MLNKIFALLFILFLGFQPVPAQNKLQIADKKVSFGYKIAVNRKIDVIVIHSSFNNSGGDQYDVQKVIHQFSKYGVCAHYLIDRNGIIYRLVDEKNIAYHAGISKLPDGRSGINSCSIGIELITSFTEAPTEAQIHALAGLVTDIKSRYKINYIVRHKDIAPDRKTDPWNMDWDDFLLLLN